MRRVVALFLEERGEIVDLLHAATPTPMLAAKLSKSASARATNPSRFLARSFTGGSSGSGSPQFSVLRWEWAGAGPPRAGAQAPGSHVGGRSHAGRSRSAPTTTAPP